MDTEKIEEFLGRFVGLASGATTIGLLAISDRNGLLTHLAEDGGGTSEDIAAKSNLEERYVREILSGLAAAAVVEYDASTGVFDLPSEHALFLANPGSPYFMGGWLDMIPAMLRHIDGVAEATVSGGGVRFEEFGPEMIRGIDRGNSPSQKVFLTSRWLPAVEGLAERLERGIRVADIGCGSGTAAILMAEAYPNSEVFGFDASDESIAMARERAEGLSNLVFSRTVAGEVPTKPGFDLITTFDVVHDLPDPEGALARINDALRTGGWYLLMEPNAGSNLEDNLHDRGALLYGISAMHCLTQALAVDGAGLGAAWGATTTQRLIIDAGFSSFQRLETISNRFSSFYLARG